MSASLAERIRDLSPKQRAMLELLLEKRRSSDSSPPAEKAVPRRQARNGKGLPLSYAQQRLWFLQQLAPDSSAYNLPFALRLDGALSVAALQGALTALVERHEALRTTFPMLDGTAVQVIAEPAPVPLPVIDLSDLPAAAAEAEAERQLDPQAWLPFDLAGGPLLRVLLLRLAECRHVSLFSLHHIIGDDWSLGLLVQDLSELYRASLAGRPSPLPLLPIQYADWASWQREWLAGGALEEQLAYWRKQLGGELPGLPLPTDRPRSAVITSRAARRDRRLPAALSRDLHRFADTRGATLFMALAAGFKTLLFHYSGQEDLTLGVPIANRNHQHAEALVGFFVNTLVLRTRLEGDPTAAALLGQVADVALAAYSHQDVPFERIVEELRPERGSQEIPLFRVMFMVQNARTGLLQLPGLSIAGVPLRRHTAKFDLLVWFDESVQGGLSCSVEYKGELFDGATIERLALHLENVLHALVEDPLRRLSALPFLSAEERHQLICECNDTAASFSSELCLHDLFAARVTLAPAAPAVTGDGQTWSYAELDGRSSQLAHLLCDLGLGPGSLVAVYLRRSLEMVSTLLGILKTGAAYVPLDAGFPPARVEALLTTLGIPALVTHEPLLREIAGLHVPCLRHVVCVGGEPSTRQRSDEPWELWTPEDLASRPVLAPPSRARAENLAYIIFTSGSTGQPKGVMVQHRPVVNLIRWVAERFGIGASDRVLFVTSLCFDLSVYDLFGILAAGGCVRVAGEADLEDPERLVRILLEEPITFWDSAPAALHRLVPFLPPRSRGQKCGLRLVFLSGDWIPLSLPERVREAFPRAQVIALGGATEATVWSNFHPVKEIDPHWVSIPYGRPIPNARYYVLAPSLRPCPIGIEGDLFIGGDVLFAGYAGAAALNGWKLLPDPQAELDGMRMYRTGDRARFRGDGSLEFLGRRDHQVKIRGYRIELAEVEAALRRHPAVKETIAVARGGPSGERRLVAYYLPVSGMAANAGELRRFLLELLPEYMVPSAFLALEAFPITANGKVDRAALPSPDAELAEPIQPAEPARSPFEAALVRIWAGLLHRQQVGIHDNFFELGGDSILGIQVVTRARQEGLQLSPRDIFQHQTIAELAAAAGASAPERAADAEVSGEVPLTPIQRWFFSLDLADPHHFNQSVLLTLARSPQPALLREAVAGLLAHHDMLRARYVRRDDGWHQLVDPPSVRVPLAAIDLSVLTVGVRRHALDMAAARLQGSLDLGTGPVVRIVLFELGQEEFARLLIVIHHLVVDGVSWRILIEDLLSAYEQLEAGAALRLPAKTASFRTWAERLWELRGSSELAEHQHFWAPQPPALTLQLKGPEYPSPANAERRANTMASARQVADVLEAAQTRSLLQAAPILHATVEEILLAALAWALARATGASSISVDLEGHGREPLGADLDVSRTVGWFTAICPVTFDLGTRAGEAAVLGAVKEQVRQVRRHAVGYGVLGLLDGSAPGCCAGASGRPEVIFNYLGQLEGGAAEDRPELAAASSAARRSERQRRAHRLELSAGIESGRLTVRWTYSEQLDRRTSIEALARDFRHVLEALVESADGETAPALVSSDFPLAGLDEVALARVVSRVRSVEDVYPLSPLQEGLLFHSLDPELSGVYRHQFHCWLDGDLDESAFRGAWREVFARHPALRTAFVWEDMDRPLQVVSREVEVPLAQLDWSGLAPHVQQQRLAAHLERERRSSLALDRAPLLRLTLIRLGEELYLFTSTHHHLVLDGWSVARLFEEMFELYQAAHSGGTPGLERVRPYRDYIAWLESQEMSAAEAFWRQELAGFRAPTPVSPPGYATSRKHSGDLFDEVRGLLPGAVGEGARSFAKSHRITLATLVQGLWGLLLHRRADVDDVVFGAVSAGRPTALRGVERMVGLFINTLPVRLRIDGQAEIAPWLAAIQDHQAESRQHEHCSLPQVQSWSEVPAGTPLFESIVVFENYPVARRVEQGGASGLKVRKADVRERTNYPLTLIVSPGEELAVRIFYDTRRFAASDVRRIHAQLETLFASALRDPGQPVGGLEVLPESERFQILREWNDTDERWPADGATLPALIAEQARCTPEAVAAGVEGAVLTYGALAARAWDLARKLVSLGVGPDTLVGIAVERSLELIVGLVGILEAGGAYLPLDLSYPAERLAFMVEDSRLRALVTCRGLEDRLSPGLRGSQVRLVYIDLGTGEEPAKDEPRGAGVRPAADNLAYAIYTSGSTGRPKAAIVTHKAIVNRLLWMQRQYRLGASDRVLQKTPASFDVSAWEFFWPLLNGAHLVVLRPEGHKDAALLHKVIAEEQVTTLHFVPTMLEAFLSAEEDLADCGSLVRVVCSGEALSLDLVRRFFARAPQGCELDNLYGPTEAAVDVTYHCCDATGEGWRIPIGRPTANTRMHLVDRALRPVPSGSPGELCITGVQLARGYLARPDLSADRFRPDPFSQHPGERMYLTGDLTRQREDGEIEFLGRLDHQIKLRGLRIELGEIEAALLHHAGVRDVVVAVSKSAGDMPRLIAYWVAEAGEAPSGEDLRSFLSVRLPDFMIPARCLRLDAFPLLPNGKVDRGALPEPEVEPRWAPPYAPPAGETERQIAEVWRDVLKVERVGRHDDFLALGGDSILAIRVVSRCRRAGIYLTPRQLFEHPSLTDLARSAAKTLPAAGGEDSVAGEVPLTPIQHWLFEQQLEEVQHFNQSLLVKPPAGTVPGLLADALALLAKHHPALRLRFRREADRWYQRCASPAESGEPFPLVTLDLAALRAQERRAAADSASELLEASLDLEAGPLARAALLLAGEGEPSRLLLVLHHLVVDAVSWGILMEDLETAYRDLRGGRPVRLSAEQTSFKRWAERLSFLADTAALRREASVWLDMARQQPPAPLPLPMPPGGSRVADARTIDVRLDARRTAALVAAPRAYLARVSDLLLAALAEAFGEWAGTRRLLLDLEGHGREDVGENVDLSRTVGWFTTVFPVLLDLEGTEEPGASIRAVKEQLRALPRQGLSYGLLRYLCTDEDVRATLGSLPPRAILFNYLGRLDGSAESRDAIGEERFVVASSGGANRHPRQRRHHLIEINAAIAGSRLEMRWTFDPRALSPDAAAALGAGFAAALDRLVDHCAARGAASYTPSDFPLARVDTPQLDALLEAMAAASPLPPLGNWVEAIYPLSPTQEGMLYESLAAPGSGIHVEQWGCRLDGLLDDDRFARAWDMALARHPILRTGFLLGDLDRPLQVVLAHVPVPLTRQDWRGLPGELRRLRLEEYLASDRRRGFDLVRPPALRLALFRLTEESSWLIWSHHHILLDGWCRPLLLREVVQTYEALRSGSEPHLPAASSYGSYIEWLTGRDPAVSEAYWQRTLEGFLEPTPLGEENDVVASPEGESHRQASVELEREESELLEEFARRHRLTQSSLIQAAWGLLLGCYSGRREVLFGVTVSGRPAELPGIETALGLFINTLPLRLRVDGERTVLAWLSEVQSLGLEMREHEHTPAARIRTAAPVAGGLPLYDSIVVFENYDQRAQAQPGGLSLAVEEVLSSGARTRHALTLIALPGVRFAFQLVADVRRVRMEDLTRILDHLRTLLARLVQEPEATLADLLETVPRSQVPRVVRSAGRSAPTVVSAPPRSPTEELIAQIWSATLGRGEVGIHESFFDLGGHSLIATQVVSRLRGVFGVEVPLRTVFEAPTVAALAREIEALRGDEHAARPAPPPLVAGERQRRPCLSFAQQRLWFLEQFDPGRPTFNIPIALRIDGPLRPDGLAQALGELARRHEVLRSSYRSEEGIPVQEILPMAPVRIPLVDLSPLPPEARAEQVAEWTRREARRPIDLAAGWPWRAALLRERPERHVFLLTFHHIVSDAWSAGILVHEVSEIYAAWAAGRPSPLAELPIQYQDFARWQRDWLRGDALAEQLGYWRRQLAGMPPLVAVPGDRPRGEVRSSRGADLPVALRGELGDALRRLSRGRGVTLYMTLLAAFKVLVRHHAGTDDVVVGTDVANRNRLETEGLIGFFVNQLVLRTSLAGDPKLGELLERVRRVTLEAYSHQDLPFERLLDGLEHGRSPGNAPLFQIKFFMGNTPRARPEQSALRIEPIPADNGSAQIDITFVLSEGADGTLHGRLNYSTDLYDDRTVRRLVRQFEQLLEHIVERPDATLGQLEEFLNRIDREQRDMERSQTPGLDFGSFKGVKPRQVSLPQERIVHTGRLDGLAIPLVIEPAMENVDLADWARGNRELLEEQLLIHGALLFRGFPVQTTGTFEAFASAVCPRLFHENGEHPREAVSGKVYTPVFYPKAQKLLLHNENSFNHHWPGKIFFCCARPPQEGGETPIVDSRMVYRQIDPEIRRRFETRGIAYVRNYYANGVGLSWQQVFGTERREEVEERCRRDQMELEWCGDDHLRTRARRPAVVTHPRTGELSWFNQAQHWHLSCLDPETRSSMLEVFREEDLPRHCYYGDGTPIEDEVMRRILEVYEQLEAAFAWRAGDVMLLDNVLAAHGRNPFAGERKILVAMGDMTSFDDVEHSAVEG